MLDTLVLVPGRQFADAVPVAGLTVVPVGGRHSELVPGFCACLALGCDHRLIAAKGAGCAGGAGCGGAAVPGGAGGPGRGRCRSPRWRAGMGWRGRRCMSGWPGMPTRAGWAGWRTGRRGRRRARIRCPRWWRRGSWGCGGSIRGGGRRGSCWELERAGVAPLPGRSAVYRALIRHGLVEPKKRKRRREDYRRWERGRAMELWQMDVMGRVHLAGGAEVKVVTGIDDHSRFIVCAKVVCGRRPGRCARRWPRRCAGTGSRSRSSPITARSSPRRFGRGPGPGDVRPDLRR